MAPRVADLLRFDTTGWLAKPPHDDHMTWTMPDGGGVGVFVFSGPPELPVVSTLAELRRIERDQLNAQGHGLVEYTIKRLPAGVNAVRSVAKMPTDPTIQITRSGLSYVGVLTIPFQRLAIVVKAQAREIGPTGLREAKVLNLALAAGRARVPKPGQIEGWVPIPADGAGFLDANLSEDEALDADFPAHPLSRLRAALNRVEQTLRLNDAVLREPPFALPTA